VQLYQAGNQKTRTDQRNNRISRPDYHHGYRLKNGKSQNSMKTQTQPVDKKQKRDYVQPEIKKREQIKEVTEGGAPVVTIKPD
jgi:hypothetical protein